jgi:hypothetical protein
MGDDFIKMTIKGEEHKVCPKSPIKVNYNSFGFGGNNPVYLYGRVLKIDGGIIYFMTPGGTVSKSGCLHVTPISEDDPNLTKWESIGNEDGTVYRKKNKDDDFLLTDEELKKEFIKKSNTQKFMEEEL